MKKFFVSFLILLITSFNSINSINAYAANTFKEGIYKAADFNFSPSNIYSVQNISERNDVYLQLFDENQIIIQAIRLTPKSEKFNLISLKPSYRIVIVGNGEVYIS
jgi:hypothetical protein